MCDAFDTWDPKSILILSWRLFWLESNFSFWIDTSLGSVVGLVVGMFEYCFWWRFAIFFLFWMYFFNTVEVLRELLSHPSIPYSIVDSDWLISSLFNILSLTFSSLVFWDALKSFWRVSYDDNWEDRLCPLFLWLVDFLVNSEIKYRSSTNA